MSNLHNAATRTADGTHLRDAAADLARSESDRLDVFGRSLPLVSTTTEKDRTSKRWTATKDGVRVSVRWTDLPVIPSLRWNLHVSVDCESPPTAPVGRSVASAEVSSMAQTKTLAEGERALAPVLAAAAVTLTDFAALAVMHAGAGQ